ncbi:hypothetical protein PAXRUDRAFT_830283 [Paxillus rubicundulus Ve08.2h10]|uniref:Wax synthase domain-containing protein n=1 Tax=Paxillus rubicundulus Ve08.2h10 TaxID=930991 RepID=A0A0D0DZ31_9AGAM|nr:hypothetical protein PAXRUDRAFT_830283 [Paxillus rubicundulus Ve08.2h10]
MSFAAMSLSDILQIPPTRAPADPTNFASYIVPPVLSYFAVAILAVTPETHSLRVALWPLVALLALRAGAFVDLSLDVPRRKGLNLNLVVSEDFAVPSIFCNIGSLSSISTVHQASMFIITTRTLQWTLQKEPLKRHIRPAGATPSIVMDALDLTVNLRGYGWDWSKGLYVPRETRPSTHTKFVAYAIFSAGLHAFLCGVLHSALQSFSPDAFGPTIGGTIFDETLPFFANYLRASIISTLVAFGLYCAMQLGYDLCIIPAVLILRQDPAQWPPAFERPWLATSVGDFWGRRWHQFYRQTFILGSYPFSFVFGRVGGIFGAFFISAVFHYIVLIRINGKTELWRMVVAFGMMALAVIGERAFRQWTGRKVGGFGGWVWTMGWVNLWGTLMVDAWARAGMFGCPNLAGSAVLVGAMVERTMMRFDTWLHTF